MKQVYFTHELGGAIELAVSALIEPSMADRLSGHPDSAEQGHSAMIHELDAKVDGREFDLDVISTEELQIIDNKALKLAGEQ